MPGTLMFCVSAFKNRQVRGLTQNLKLLPITWTEPLCLLREDDPQD